MSWIFSSSTQPLLFWMFLIGDLLWYRLVALNHLKWSAKDTSLLVKIPRSVREICFSRRLRKMILLRRVNGVGGNNKNCWNLFYRCTGLKICFWYICTPGRKLGKTACCQIIVFLRLFSSVFRILLRFY